MKEATKAMPGRRPFSFSRLAYWSVIVFLFLPLLVFVVFSFNESKTAVWEGFSLKWYLRLFQDSRDIWRAFRNTIIIAITSALSSTVIGTLAAIGVHWYQFRSKVYVRAITFLPLILPEIILGLSLLVYFKNIGLPGSLISVFIAHTTFSLPFVFLMVTARLDEFDDSVIEAAQDLGATEKQTLFKVILPMSMPGIISGFITAITLSLEDFITTFLVAGPDSATLPSKIYAMLPRGGITPVINALSTIMILGTIALALIARNFLKYIAK